MTDLLFVGEAPSHEEIETGFPLVGPSGRVFNQILRQVGLAKPGQPPATFLPNQRRAGVRGMLWERRAVAVTNVFDFKLEDNDVGSICLSAPNAKSAGCDDADFYISGSGFVDSRHRCVLDRLRDEVADANPAVIVPLGSTALWAFTTSTAITESRGTVLRATRVAPGVKLVPTLHPAHVLQDWRMLTVVIGDVRRAVAECADRDRIIHRGQRELWIEPTLGDLDVWWREHGARSRLLSIDIETPRGQISCVGIGADAVSAICVPFIDWRKPDRSYWPSPEHELIAWDWVERVCGNDTPKVLQNGTFDTYWLLREMGVRLKNYCHDTRLMGHALHCELPKSLAFLGSAYAKPPGAWKTMRAHSEEKRDA